MGGSVIGDGAGLGLRFLGMLVVGGRIAPGRPGRWGVEAW